MAQPSDGRVLRAGDDSTAEVAAESAARADIEDLRPVASLRCEAERTGVMRVGGRTRIGDYAIIGDGRSAALVDRSGSIDWLCWPRFDSPSLFGALLDDDRGGRFRIAPTEPGGVHREYESETNVLHTLFSISTGTLRLTDLMPVASEEQKRRMLSPEHELLRIARCESGEVELEVIFEPRPDFGRGRVRLQDGGAFGICLEHGPQLTRLLGEVPLTVEGTRARGHVRLRAGETVRFSLSHARDAPGVLPLLGAAAEERLRRSVRWWREWVRRCSWEGPHRDDVVRSLLALKLLTYAPSGAIIAAPTTSLPERPGGDLNWDYRFCWVRDAAFTSRALFDLGFPEEAEAFVGWMLHSTRLTWPQLEVAYDVFGRRLPEERELDHLAGHAGSRPVRTGNAAGPQLQLDTYGEVIDAAYQLVLRGGELDSEVRRMLVAFGEYVCRHWEQPDSGIWEPRGERRHYTHSKVLCWTALDRLLRLQDRGQLAKAPLERFNANRDMLRSLVEGRGWNEHLGSYTQTLGGDRVDASLLQLSWYGFERADSPRQHGTFRRIHERLAAGPGRLYRYEQSLRDGEGAFGICSFWAVEHLARGCGTLAEAEEWFRLACSHRNDVGLFAEEMDPRSGAHWGNFPQAFTHVGLINAAISLRERAAREGRPKAGRPVEPSRAAEPEVPR